MKVTTHPALGYNIYQPLDINNLEAVCLAINLNRREVSRFFNCTYSTPRN